MNVFPLAYVDPTMKVQCGYCKNVVLLDHCMDTCTDLYSFVCRSCVKAQEWRVLIGRPKENEHYGGSPEKEERNIEIAERYWSSDLTHKELAADYDISDRRVAQIAEKYKPIGASKVHRQRTPGQRIHVTPEQVAEMREKYSTGNYTQRDLAEEYGVDQSWVSRNIRGVV